MIKKGFLLLFALSLFGCSPKPVFDGSAPMENSIWNRFNFLIFEVPVVENELLDFYLKVDFTDEYSKEELITNITFYAPDGSMRSADYTFPLNESTKVKGATQQHLFSFRTQMLFSSGGICEVRIENKATKVQTPGISSVGIIARRSE